MKPFAAIALALALAGCMTEREYMLRNAQIKALSAHPPVYDVITIQGPLTLDAGSVIQAKSPTQPLSLPPVPDGQAAQTAIIRDAVTGAIIGYGINRAAATTKKNTNITNNYQGATP